jgi:hypothetical protein
VCVRVCFCAWVHACAKRAYRLLISSDSPETGQNEGSSYCLVQRSERRPCPRPRASLGSASFRRSTLCCDHTRTHPPCSQPCSQTVALLAWAWARPTLLSVARRAVMGRERAWVADDVLRDVVCVRVCVCRAVLPGCAALKSGGCGQFFDPDSGSLKSSDTKHFFSSALSALRAPRTP